jgi:hypothetical protein
MREHGVVNRWLAASALHKSLRRGHADLARRYASDLLRDHPSYLSFRLGTIALEEVGPGDWELVASTLEAIRDRKYAALPDLAGRLAEAPKSRSCVYAKRLKPGDTLTLPPLARFLSEYGKGFEKLGLAIPHVWQMVENAETEIVVNDPDVLGDELIGGLPAATYDRHTSPGKLAIRMFARGFPQWTEEQVSYAVFCVEGAYIDRELVFDGSETLKIDAIEAGYRERGLTSRDQMLDLDILIRHIREQLNYARRLVIVE